MRRKSLVRLLASILIFACVAPFFELISAQEPIQMTLEGNFTVAHTATGDCMVCVPPSSSASIKLVVDFETQSVTGQIIGGQGSGQATTYLCDDNNQPTNDQATAQGTTFYSGPIHSGSVDPQTGRINAIATLQIDGTVGWVSGCPGCPTGSDAAAVEATITGVVNKDGTASGQISWGQQCRKAGEWYAQATSIEYAATPTSTATSMPTQTSTQIPTGTPTSYPTSTVMPTETATANPTATATRETAGGLSAPAEDEGPKIPSPGEGGLLDPGTSSTKAPLLDLENLLAGQGANGPTPGEAATAAVATVALLGTWMLNQLLSGVSKEDILKGLGIKDAQGPLGRAVKEYLDALDKTPKASKGVIAKGTKVDHRAAKVPTPLSVKPPPGSTPPSASSVSFLENLYKKTPTNFRRCQDMPWAYLHKKPPPPGGRSNDEVWREMRRQHYKSEIWGDFRKIESDAIKLTRLQDGDIVMLDFHDLPIPGKVPHYAVVDKGKIYMIWNAPRGGRYECIDLEDFSKLFASRTEKDSFGKTHLLEAYRYFDVYRKPKP